MDGLRRRAASHLVLALGTCSLGLGPAVAQVGERAERALPSSVAAELDAELARQLAPTGPAERGWSDAGVEMETLLRGGGEERVMFTPDDEMPSALMLGGVVEASLPAGWTRTRSREVGTVGDQNLQTALLRLSPTKLLAATETTRRVGTASCSAGGLRLTLFEKAGGEAAPEEDDMMDLVMGRMFERVADAEICTLYRRGKGGGFVAHHYLADGRPLGRMTEAGEERPVPARDISRVLGIAD